MKTNNLINLGAGFLLVFATSAQVLANPLLVQKPQKPTASQTQLDNFVKQGVLGEDKAPSSFELKVAAKTEGQKALHRALTKLGYKETPFGSNCNFFSSYFGRGCEAWCGSFVFWAFDGDGNKKLPWANVSAVSSILEWGRKNNYITRSPRTGDIFILKGSGISHTGIVRSTSGSTFTTVEGNADNGVRSYRRTIHSYTYFVRVPN
jgi:CHAP domain